MLYRLIILTGPLARQQITVDRAPMVIGSGPDCAIRLEDEEVVSRHAVLEHRDEGLFIRDLGSQGALLVNHREVRECQLKHGDDIEIGRTRFLVQARVKAEVDGAAGGDARLRRKRAALVLSLAVAGLSGVGLILYYRPTGDEPTGARPAARAEAERDALAPLVPPLPAAGAAAEARAVTNQPAQATGAAAPAPSAEEIQKIREDLKGIRQMMQSLVEKQGPTGAVASAGKAETNRAVATAGLPKSGEPGVGILAARAGATNREESIEQLMTDIRMAMALKEFGRAERLVAGVRALDRDYWPAYEEEALMFEQQGRPDRAAGVWQEVAKRSRDAKWTEKANGEQARLARLQKARSADETRRIRIASVDPTRFPASETYDEMRTFAVTLQREGAGGAAGEPARVEVVFYDKDPGTGAIAPSRILAPAEPLKVDGDWAAGGQKTVTATYTVPAGSRTAAGRPRPEFYGYVVRVYSANRLQDQAAKPPDLLSRGTPAPAR